MLLVVVLFEEEYKAVPKLKSVITQFSIVLLPLPFIKILVDELLPVIVYTFEFSFNFFI